MDLERLRLVRFTDASRQEYTDFADELVRAGDERSVRAFLNLGWTALLALRRRESKGTGLADGQVPQTVFLLVDDSDVVHGELRLRHRLNDTLLLEGGHIGYLVRPASRRCGVGRRLLALGLLEARALGIDRALLTCDESNLGSIGVIEANGGRDYKTGPSPHSGVTIRRYWLDTDHDHLA